MANEPGQIAFEAYWAEHKDHMPWDSDDLNNPRWARVEAAIRASALDEAAAWQPIETAPKVNDDPELPFGPMVLLCSTHAHIAVGYWGEGLSGRKGWVNPHDHRVMEYWNGFTHWMPIPERPPRPADGGEAG